VPHLFVELEALLGKANKLPRSDPKVEVLRQESVQCWIVLEKESPLRANRLTANGMYCDQEVEIMSMLEFTAGNEYSEASKQASTNLVQQAYEQNQKGSTTVVQQASEQNKDEVIRNVEEMLKKEQADRDREKVISDVAEMLKKELQQRRDGKANGNDTELLRKALERLQQGLPEKAEPKR